MMVELFLCCAPADREIAGALAHRLERNAELTVTVDDTAGDTIPVKWEYGLSSSAILLLLSPDSVPPLVSREDWGPLLDHMTSQASPRFGALLVRSCGYPRLLEKCTHFFRWESGPREAAREIEKWALSLHGLPQQRSFAPARLPWFRGRDEELGRLWEALVDRVGTAIVAGPDGSGKTSLAQEFSRQAGAHFRDILWVDCSDRSLASAARELASQAEVEHARETSDELHAVVERAGNHRVLIVLDDFPPDAAIPADSSGHASLLVTTPSVDVQAPAQLLNLDGAPQIPLAFPDHPVDRRLFRAMAVCRRGGFPLELAVRIAEIEASEVPVACARLIEARLADPLDDLSGRLRLSRASVAAAGACLERERRRHAETISQSLATPESNRPYFAEVMPAFRWAVCADWPLATALALRAFAKLRRCDRMAEGAELLVALQEAAGRRGDREVAEECAWELSWIVGPRSDAPIRRRISGDQLQLDFTR